MIREREREITNEWGYSNFVLTISLQILKKYAFLNKNYLKIMK